jgi:hypothetical protein
VKLTHTHSLPAPRIVVYDALMDPAVLQACIEGCQKLVLVAAGAYDVELRVGVSAIKGTYRGKVLVLDPRPPESFTLKIEGKGLTGFIQSTTRLELRDGEGVTEINAEATATVGGVIAAVGSRLIDGFARKMTVDFFARLEKELERRRQ